jgi:hypothetical protein
MKNFCAFDIEIAKDMKDGMDKWRSQRPLGITCAATLTSEGQLNLWYGKTSDGQPADRMTPADTTALVYYLDEMVKQGFTILSWNGLGFDFDILSEESGEKETCKKLALSHVDMMFHIFCLRGHTLGLDKAARGMGVPGKTAGMSGALAPQYWAEGQRSEVLDYVAQDTRATLGVAQAVENQKVLKWFSTSGSIQRVPFPNGWLTVQGALKLPQPIVRGLSNPLSRHHFTDWTEG